MCCLIRSDRIAIFRGKKHPCNGTLILQSEGVDETHHSLPFCTSDRHTHEKRGQHKIHPDLLRNKQANRTNGRPLGNKRDHFTIYYTHLIVGCVQMRINHISFFSRSDTPKPKPKVNIVKIQFRRYYWIVQFNQSVGSTFHLLSDSLAFAKWFSYRQCTRNTLHALAFRWREGDELADEMRSRILYLHSPERMAFKLKYGGAYFEMEF